MNTPQFPFGFGLSYTTFRYGMTEISAKQLHVQALNPALKGNSSMVLTASASVTNAGQKTAEEVVQLYLGIRGTSIAQPVRALKGFQRVTLAPGETKTIKFDLGPDTFSVWTDQQRFAVEPSQVSVWIAPDSAHGSEAKLEIVP
jgi:beta-glucosidase